VRRAPVEETMRKTVLLVGVVATLSFATVAHAENFDFGLEGGMSIPTGDYGDAFGPGPMFGVFGDLGVNPNLSLGADIIGNFHGMSDSFNDNFSVSGFDVDFTVVQFGAHARFRPTLSGLWLQGGLGAYNGHTKVTFPGFEGDDSATKLGFSVGAGMDFPFNPAMNFGLMATFHNVTDAIEEFDPTTGLATGNTRSAQYVSIGATMTFLTAP
jgi:hypothetical protein